MDSNSVRDIDRRRVGGVGLAAASVVAAGVPLVGARLGHAASAPAEPDALVAPEPSGQDRIPPDTRA
jgi:hypothetical protein